MLLAGVAAFVVVLVLNEGQIQAGYLRYIAIPRQHVSYRRPRAGITRSALSCSSSPIHPSMYKFSKDSRPPPALVSYPGSGSTLVRLVLELSTQFLTGSVYGDISLYNNSAHPFLGEFNTTKTCVVKVRLLESINLRFVLLLGQSRMIKNKYTFSKSAEKRLIYHESFVY